MSIFKREKRAKPTPLDDITVLSGSRGFWGSLNNTNPVAFFCENLLADSISSMPIRIRDRKTWQREDGHPVAWLLNNPNFYEGHSTFYSSLVKHILGGNGFIFKTPSRSQIILIDPRRVTIEMQGWAKSYRIDGTEYDYQSVIHIPSKVGYNGVQGRGILDYARETIGSSNDLQEYTRAYYSNNPNTRIKLHIEDAETSPEDITRMRDFAAASANRANSGKPIVELGANKVEPFTVPGTSNELVGSREFEARQICALYGVPYELYDPQSLSGVSLENIYMRFRQLSLTSYTDRIEEYLMMGLLTMQERSRYVIEFDYSELLRPDTKTLADIRREDVKIGLLSPNEARAEKGRSPFPKEIAGEVPIRDGVGPLAREVVDSYAAGARLKLAEAQNKTVLDGPQKQEDNKAK